MHAAKSNHCINCDIYCNDCYVFFSIISHLSKVLPSILEMFNPLFLMRNECGQASF